MAGVRRFLNSRNDFRVHLLWNLLICINNTFRTVLKWLLLPLHLMQYRIYVQCFMLTWSKGPITAFILFSCIVLMYFNCAPWSAFMFYGILLMLHYFSVPLFYFECNKYQHIQTQMFSLSNFYLNGLLCYSWSYWYSIRNHFKILLSLSCNFLFYRKLQVR